MRVQHGVSFLFDTALLETLTRTAAEALLVPLPVETLHLLGEVDALPAARAAVRVLHVHVLLRRRLGRRRGRGRHLAVALVAKQAVFMEVARSGLQLFLAILLG